MRRRCLWPAGAAVSALALALAGCGATGSATSAPSAAAKQCGSGRTAANVRVLIEVNRGSVACPTALQIEQSYAAALGPVQRGVGCGHQVGELAAGSPIPGRT